MYILNSIELCSLVYYFHRWQKGKVLLLASLSCWIIFTVPLGFIQPVPTSCLVKKNYTVYVLEAPKSQIFKRETSPEQWSQSDETVKSATQNYAENDEEISVRQVRSAKIQNFQVGQSPLNIDFASNYNEKEQNDWVSPIFSSIVYRTQV